VVFPANLHQLRCGGNVSIAHLQKVGVVWPNPSARNFVQNETEFTSLRCTILLQSAYGLGPFWALGRLGRFGVAILASLLGQNQSKLKITPEPNGQGTSKHQNYTMKQDGSKWHILQTDMNNYHEFRWKFQWYHTAIHCTGLRGTRHKVSPSALFLLRSKMFRHVSTNNDPDTDSFPVRNDATGQFLSLLFLALLG